MSRVIWLGSGLGRVMFGVMIGARVRFTSETCKLCICDFEIVRHFLQIAQIDKLHAKLTLLYIFIFYKNVCIVVAFIKL